MYDFCLTFPFAAFVAAGGILGFVLKGSIASLSSGLGCAAVLGACGYLSYQDYHRGRLCRPATLVSLAVSAALAYGMYQRYLRTQKVMPAGMVAVISAAMVAFYAWNLLLFTPKFGGAKQH